MDTFKDFSVASQTFINELIVEGTSYALSCYGKENASTSCTRFSSPRLTWSPDWNTSCPFGQTVCLDPELGVALDTGYLDSNVFLGINTHSREQSVGFRKVTHCAPLVLDGHTEEVDHKIVAEYFPELSLTPGEKVAVDHLSLGHG